MNARDAGEFRNGWGVVVASMIGIGLGLTAVPFYSLGVFAGPVTEEFGWTRGDYMSVTLLMVALTLVLCPIIGKFADKGHVKSVATGSLVALGVLFCSLSLLPANANIWTFYAIYIAMAIFASGSLSITFTRSITGWFVVHRGLALAIALAGVGICALLLPAYTDWAISRFGFRGAYIAVGILPLFVGAPVVAILLRNPPALPAGEAQPAGGMPAPSRMLDGALRSHRFWILVGLAIFASAAASGTAANLVPLLVERGYERATAAGMAGIFGLALIVGRLITGALVDRLWAPMVGCVSLCICAAGLSLFTLGGLGTTGDAIAVASVGFASGAEIDLIAYLVSRYFPARSYARIYGVLYGVAAAGGGSSTAMFGRSFDHFGSYQPILHMSVVALALTALSLLLMGPYPERSTTGTAPGLQPASH